MKLDKHKLWTALMLTSLLSPLPALSQNPGFQLPGQVGNIEDESMPGDKKVKTPTSGGSDYTEDEKRMQKKYKEKVRNAKELIDKGDHMMKGSAANSKDYKKGKIFKEIGERELAELEANNPFPKSDKDKPAKAGAKSEADKKEL